MTDLEVSLRSVCSHTGKGLSLGEPVRRSCVYVGREDAVLSHSAQMYLLRATSFFFFLAKRNNYSLKFTVSIFEKQAIFLSEIIS